MPDTKAIRQKMKSIGNIKKITKTMEMVSVAKMKKSTETNSRGKAYATHMMDLLSHIAIQRNLSHPLLGPTEDEEKRKVTMKELVIVISSNKGLAGSYNTNISKALLEYKKKSDSTVDTITIGKQSEKSARRHGLNIVASFVTFSEKTSSDEFLSIRDMIIEKFKAGDYDKVSVLYTEWKSAMSYKPFMMQLIPIVPNLYSNFLLDTGVEDATPSKDMREYKFEPDMQSILDQLVPQSVALAVFHAFQEAQASEHSARMFAMKNANDNAGEILSDLTLYYNQARQAAITQEISEIVGGASAQLSN
jgi:F-type H+-transporting ATPase subunit gamma